MLSSLASEQMVERFGTHIEYEKDSSAQSRFWNWEFCSRVGWGISLLVEDFSIILFKPMRNITRNFWNDGQERFGPATVCGCRYSVNMGYRGFWFG